MIYPRCFKPEAINLESKPADKGTHMVLPLASLISLFSDLFNSIFSYDNLEAKDVGQFEIKGKKKFGQPHYRLLKKQYQEKTGKVFNKPILNDLNNRPSENYAVHLYNEVWRRNGCDKNAIYEQGCLYEQLKQRYGVINDKNGKSKTIIFTNNQGGFLRTLNSEGNPSTFSSNASSSFFLLILMV